MLGSEICHRLPLASGFFGFGDVVLRGDVADEGFGHVVHKGEEGGARDVEGGA